MMETTGDTLIGHSVSFLVHGDQDRKKENSIAPAVVSNHYVWSIKTCSTRATLKEQSGGGIEVMYGREDKPESLVASSCPVQAKRHRTGHRESATHQ